MASSDSDLLRQFWKYIQLDDVRAMSQFLDEHPSPDWFTRRSMGATALHVACRSGCTKAIRFLVENGADVNVARTSDNATPLILACKYGQVEAVKSMLEVGKDALDVSRGMKYGVTAIHSASKAGHADIVRILLQVCSPDLTMTHGATPVYLSAENNHLECLQLLLEHGACPEASMRSCTPLFIAAQNGHYGAVKLLLEHSIHHERPLKQMDQSLFIAAQQGHTRVVEYLLEMGSSPNAKNSGGVTVLCVCVIRTRREIFELLLQRHADVNERLPDGSTALSIAVQKDRPEFVTRLLQCPTVDASVRFKDGATPLHVACFYGRIDMIRQLVEAGADVNARRKDGITPLYFALQNKHWAAAAAFLALDTEHVVECREQCDRNYPLYLAASQSDPALVAAILARDADVNARQPDGATALLLACSVGEKDVALRLLKAGADPTLSLTSSGATPLHVAVQAGHANLARVLLTTPLISPPLDVNAALLNGSTPLHLAVANSRARCVEVLLGHGAKANIPDGDECYPLYVAAHQGDRDVVALLLRHGADPDLGNKPDLATPLHICAHAEDSSTRCAIARLLIQNGATLDPVMEDGASPLYVACYEGAVRLMRLLLDFGVNPDGARLGMPSPIHVACEKKQIIPLKMLLNYGANPDVQLECGATALFICAENGFDDGARWLLKYHASVDLPRKDGTTPLWTASHQGHLNVVIQLLSRSANVHTRGGSKSETPIQVAVRRKHTMIAQVLKLAADDSFREASAHLLSLLRSAAQRAATAELELEELREHLDAALVERNEVQVVALARPHEFEVLKYIAGNEYEALYHTKMKRNGVKYTMKVIFNFEDPTHARKSMFFQELCIHRIMRPHRHLYGPLTHFVASPTALKIPRLPPAVVESGGESSIFLIAPIYAMNLSKALKEDFSERPLRLSIALRWAKELCEAVDHLLSHNVAINSITVSDVLLDVPPEKTVDEGSLVLAGLDRAVTFDEDERHEVHQKTAFGVGCILFELLHPMHVHPLVAVQGQFSLDLLLEALHRSPASSQCKDMILSMLLHDEEEPVAEGMQPYILALTAELAAL